MQKIIYFILFLFILFFIYLLIENKRIVITNYSFNDERISKPLRIVHLSDIHNDLFGKDNKSLIEKVKNQNPDYIFITGDLIDSRRTNTTRALKLIKELVKITDIYYIAGNHESRIKEYPQFEEELKKLNVNVINDKRVVIDNINLYGIKDYNFYHLDKSENESIIKKQLDDLHVSNNKDIVNFLLVHRPQYFENYCQYNFDYIFSGHVHGGQMRLPYIGGLYGPNQGILPKYDSGIHKKGNKTMILSRGLGNSLFPFRIFDNPEIVVVDFNVNSPQE